MLQNLLSLTLIKLLPRKVALEEPIRRSSNTRDDNSEMKPRDTGCDGMYLIEVPENKSPVAITVVIKRAGNFSSYQLSDFRGRPWSWFKYFTTNMMLICVSSHLWCYVVLTRMFSDTWYGAALQRVAFRRMCEHDIGRSMCLSFIADVQLSCIKGPYILQQFSGFKVRQVVTDVIATELIFRWLLWL